MPACAATSLNPRKDVAVIWPYNFIAAEEPRKFRSTSDVLMT
jgi:hypothetical protein